MPSPLDELYESLFGELPKKSGTAYELLCAAVWKLLNEDAEVIHDSRLKGEISKSLYQVDVDTKDKDGRHFGEAKDYTKRGGKVGRPDLQKLGGALPELSVETGKFFSATNYTKPAQQYASGSEEIIGKKIDLYHLRPVVEKDKEGRIEKIISRFHITTPAYDRSQFEPVWTREGISLLQSSAKSGLIPEALNIHIGDILNSDREVINSIRNLTSKGFGKGCSEQGVIGSWWLPGGHVEIESHLFPIHGITYQVKFNTEIREMVIEADGNAVLLLKSEDGSVDKLIQDVDLKRIVFDSEGQAKLKS